MQKCHQSDLLPRNIFGGFSDAAKVTFSRLFQVEFRMNVAKVPLKVPRYGCSNTGFVSNGWKFIFGGDASS